MITINHTKIKTNRNNEVTSEKVFKDKKIRNQDGSFAFHEEGIFSPRIFGRFGKCSCKALTKPGICKHCGTRVLNKKYMPDFYISFENLLDIPYMDIEQPHIADFSTAKKLLHYRGFIYDGEYIEFNLYQDDLNQYDKDKVLIGKKAILSLGETEEWYERQVRDKLSVPHTSLRRIVSQSDQYFLGTLNTILIDILKKKKMLTYYAELNTEDVFYELNIKQHLLQKVKELQEEIFNMIAKNKGNIVARELRGQGLTGIIRGVITNNFNLDEDIILIGSYFIETLYPKLYKEFTVDGKTDIRGLNQYLKDEQYYVLLNRQPTIGAKSILGMKPVFSDKESEKYVIQLSPLLCSPLAGDFDGDVCSIIALYTKAACKEAQRLLPSLNYIEGSDSSIRSSLPEDFEYAMQKTFEDKTKLINKLNAIIQNRKLDQLPRSEYIDLYHTIGENMFSACYIPNVADFANAFGDKNGKTKEALEKIEQITKFTGNHDDILNSVKKHDSMYTEEESSKFMNSVIAANVTDITESGYFYKKLISSCDNMKIDLDYEDCKSNGEHVELPVTKQFYDFQLRNRFIVELDSYTETYDEFVAKTNNLKEIHVRTFLTCKRSLNHKTFCKKCAGIFKREHDSTFIPKHIGIYSTLMITEHATQASLDSMNKGASEKLNVLLEQSIDNEDTKTYKDVQNVVKRIIDEIGYIGVEARFYEIALLSRMYRRKNGTFEAAPLVTSFMRQDDEFGAFIYRPSKTTFTNMIHKKKITGNSVKSKIAFDLYD